VKTSKGGMGKKNENSGEGMRYQNEYQEERGGQGESGDNNGIY